MLALGILWMLFIALRKYPSIPRLIEFLLLKYFDFSFLRDHFLVLPVVQCLGIFFSYISSSNLAIKSGKVIIQFLLIHHRRK